MNATENTVKRYVETLHGSLLQLSGRFFSPEQSKQLLHNSLLPAKIVCYISTQFGIGFEYSAAPQTKIETVRGSARVEDLFVQAPKQLGGGPLFLIEASDITIGKLTLAGKFPFRLGDNEASVKFWDVRFADDSLSWKRDVEYAETTLTVRRRVGPSTPLRAAPKTKYLPHCSWLNVLRRRRRAYTNTSLQFMRKPYLF